MYVSLYLNWVLFSVSLFYVSKLVLILTMLLKLNKVVMKVENLLLVVFGLDFFVLYSWSGVYSSSSSSSCRDLLRGRDGVFNGGSSDPEPKQTFFLEYITILKRNCFLLFQTHEQACDGDISLEEIFDTFKNRD